MSDDHRLSNGQVKHQTTGLHGQVENAALLGLPICRDECAATGPEAIKACPTRLAEVHRAYVSGMLSEDLMLKIDRHLLSCRRCENTWDALTGALEDGMPTEVCDDEQEDDCLDLEEAPTHG